MRLWIRADGSAQLGLGHIMRTIAVAERARERHIPVRYLVGGSPRTLELVEARGFVADYVDETEDAALERMQPADAVIFDGYHFPADLMQSARDIGCQVAAIDDLGTGDFPVDVLLNQNPIRVHDYTVSPDTAVLLGVRYALVRREFTRRRRRRSPARARTLVVTMGGSDVAGLSMTTLELLPSREDFERVVLLLGPAANLGRTRPRPRGVEILQAPPDVGAVFDAADAAIAAAGSTTWELLSMGIPSALVEVADNQAAVGMGVRDAGAGIYMGKAAVYPEMFGETVRQLAEPAVRERLGRRALELVDGDGADRLLTALLARDRARS